MLKRLSNVQRPTLAPNLVSRVTSRDIVYCGVVIVVIVGRCILWNSVLWDGVYCGGTVYRGSMFCGSVYPERRAPHQAPQISSLQCLKLLTESST